MDTSTYLLSSRTEYSASDSCRPIENLEECDEGKNGCNERDDLCRASQYRILTIHSRDYI